MSYSRHMSHSLHMPTQVIMTYSHVLLSCPTQVLLMTYSLEPHVVIGCHAHSGGCARLFTSTSTLWRERIPSAIQGLSGGTSCVPLRGSLVCLAHFKSVRAAIYHHVFYAIRDAPPFKVQLVSAPFRLPTSLPSPAGARAAAGGSGVQFASGLAFWPNSSVLSISYGEADCRANVATIAAADVYDCLEHGRAPSLGAFSAEINAEIAKPTQALHRRPLDRHAAPPA